MNRKKIAICVCTALLCVSMTGCKKTKFTFGSNSFIKIGSSSQNAGSATYAVSGSGKNVYFGSYVGSLLPTTASGSFSGTFDSGASSFTGTISGSTSLLNGQSFTEPCSVSRDKKGNVQIIVFSGRTYN